MKASIFLWDTIRWNNIIGFAIEISKGYRRELKRQRFHFPLSLFAKQSKTFRWNFVTILKICLSFFYHTENKLIWRRSVIYYALFNSIKWQMPLIRAFRWNFRNAFGFKTFILFFLIIFSLFFLILFSLFFFNLFCIQKIN